EAGLRSFLNRVLPERYEAAAGFTFGDDGDASTQSDVLILDRLACTRVLRFNHVGLFPFDAVMGRIEVKRTLTTASFAQDLKRIVEFRSGATYLKAGTGRCTPRGYLFAANTDADAATVAQWYANAFHSRSKDERAFLPNALIVQRKVVVLPV